jgi:acyl carrier protein
MMADVCAPMALAGDPIFARVVAAIRATQKGKLPDEIVPDHSFVLDLGFDSMSVALLALALEDQFSCAILLDGWIGEHAHPAALTVKSLCEYLARSLSPDEQSALHQ